MATTMTRQHFQLIADVLENANYEWEDGNWSGAPNELASMFANRLATTNPNFDRERFLTAAGVK